MGRPSKGWSLRKKPGEKFWCVRFTINGKQHEPSTGEEDKERAAERAAQIYAEAKLRGSVRTRRQAAVDSRQLGEAAAEWLSDVGNLLDEQTEETYALYFEKYLTPFFGTVDAVVQGGAIDQYIKNRLEKVSAASVRKELSALRGFVGWAASDAKKLIPEVYVPGIPKRTVGTPVKGKQKVRTPVSPDEMERILEAMPERAPIGGWPVRARFVVMYETSLRPETLDQLSVPEHYVKGAKQFRIPRELDKARDGRPVPLSARARRELDAIVPEKGLIFGRHRCRHDVKAAAAKVLKDGRQLTFHPYDIRSAALTHMLELGASLPGVQWLAGHKHVSTTSKYIAASLRAAEDAVTLVDARRSK